MATIPSYNSSQSLHDPLVGWLKNPNPNSQAAYVSTIALSSSSSEPSSILLRLPILPLLDEPLRGLVGDTAWTLYPGQRAEVGRGQSVKLENNKILSISIEKKKKNQDLRDLWYRLERKAGKFNSTFRLLKNSKVDKIKASLVNRFTLSPNL